MSNIPSDIPLVSIVLPVWNGERYLAGAIESVLAQTERDFELIIVNDCSMDSSLQIAETYAARDARIRILNNKTNLKLPASLNRGFEVARGTYFSWTSDDNLLHPGFLATLLEMLRRSKADLVYSDFNLIDDSGEFLRISRVGLPTDLVAVNTIGASFLYAREVHRALGGYDTGKFLYEDYDFWVRAYLAGFRFVRSDEIVYDYRVHEGSLTSVRKFPDAFVLYRYDLRRRFPAASREAAFSARVALLGYHRVLGIRRWATLLLELLALRPVETAQILSRYLARLPRHLAAPREVR